MTTANLGQMYATSDRMGEGKRDLILFEADAWLARFDAGVVV